MGLLPRSPTASIVRGTQKSGRAPKRELPLAYVIGRRYLVIESHNLKSLGFQTNPKNDVRISELPVGHSTKGGGWERKTQRAGFW